MKNPIPISDECSEGCAGRVPGQEPLGELNACDDWCGCFCHGPVRHWISVTDHLPEEGVYVLIHTPTEHWATSLAGFVVAARDQDGIWRNQESAMPAEPTHWQPLPDPPEEK